jgi:nucleotide-binding universal stress UspA family protein
MNTWMLLAGLVLIALVYVVLPVASAVFTHYRRPRQLRCPVTTRDAVVSIDPMHAARAAVIGRWPDAVQTCSLWPARAGCWRDCLQLPEEAMHEVEDATLPPPAHPGIRRILVPLDGTAASEAALAFVADLARARGARVRLMRVATIPGEVRGIDDRIVAYADQEAARVENDLGAYLKSVAAGYPDLDVDTVVAFGDPAEEILREAAAADVVAMVGHLRSAPARWFHRSVVAAVAAAGRVPVIVVPERRALPAWAVAASLAAAPLAAAR